ncbi:WD repeat-containing protein 18 [Sparganum proliferum]
MTECTTIKDLAIQLTRPTIFACMAVPPLLLSTVANADQDAVIAWDPLAGNPIASFSGDTPTRSTLMVTKSLVLCAVAKKPVLQMWSFKSSVSHKRLTTKGVVNALAFTNDDSIIFLAIEKNIYAYQTCSGCMLSVMEASHLAPIGQLVVSAPSPTHPALLLSADTAGTLACWVLDSLSDGFTDLGQVQPLAHWEGNENSSRHRPLWFVVQASRTLPNSAFFGDGMVVTASTDGLKFFDALTGRLLSTVLSNSPPSSSVCTAPYSDHVFCGTENGILHTVWMKNPQDLKSLELSFRRCFAESGLSAAQKTITYVVLAPEGDLLAVGARAGLVEILRMDGALTRLQRFSLLQSAAPSEVTAGSVITGLCFVSRPHWLASSSSPLESSTGAAAGDGDSEDWREDPFVSLRPFKRQLGWSHDDLYYLRLPNLRQDRLPDSLAESIYKDDFIRMVTDRTVNAPFAKSIHVLEPVKGIDSKELDSLKAKCAELEEEKRELLRISVANILHF